MPTIANTPPPAPGFNPVAAIAAIIVPGGGHMASGEMHRGVMVAAGILGLFFGGILIGGIDVIDSKEDRVWFYGQALVGPIAFGVDYIHQSRFKVHLGHEKAAPGKGASPAPPTSPATRSAHPDEIRNPFTGEPAPIFVDSTGHSQASVIDPATKKPITISPARPPNIKSLSKVNELGTLFATIAGMLNVIMIVDAAFPSARRLRHMGLKTTHADAKAPDGTPAVGDDPLGGATPGARP